MILELYVHKKRKQSMNEWEKSDFKLRYKNVVIITASFMSIAAF